MSGIEHRQGCPALPGYGHAPEPCTCGAMTAEPDLLPSSVAAFTEALKGGRGSLDAWLEVNDEREVAAHVEAYARARVSSATEAMRAEVEMLRDAFSDEDMTAGAHWFGRYVEQKRIAERLTEALRQIAKYKGNPNTPVRNSVEKSAIARAALKQEAGRE